MKRRTRQAIFSSILIAAIALASCAPASDSNEESFTPSPTIRPSHSATTMSQTQYASASNAPITVLPTTQRLVLTGAKGKRVYITRTNGYPSSLSGKKVRLARFEPASSGSVSKSLFADEAAKGLFAGQIDFEKEEDPRALLEEYFMQELKKAPLASKSVAEGLGQNKNYALNAEDDFWVITGTNNKLTEEKFKLIISENGYNVWVNESDSYYTQHMNDFLKNAKALGQVFYNSYILVSNIYGSPANYLYKLEGGKYKKSQPMSSHSRAGEKINIMLSSLLNFNYYGYFNLADLCLDQNQSNQGRYVYIDSKTLYEDLLTAESTAMHEFSHVISRTKKTLEQNLDWYYWYGEYLAMLCEDMMQEHLGIEQYVNEDKQNNLACSPKGRLSKACYMAWENGLSGKDPITYSAAFKLGAWCARKFGGIKFIKEVATNGYVNIDSILVAIKSACGKTYTAESLLQEFAGDQLWEESGRGMNRDATNNSFTCSYSGGTYNYPLAAINLWDTSGDTKYFYAWADKWTDNNGTKTNAFENLVFNQSVTHNDIKTYASANIYADDAYSSAECYIGPLVFNAGNIFDNIGPYESSLATLGTADSDSVTIEFFMDTGTEPDKQSDVFEDLVTIWVK